MTTFITRRSAPLLAALALLAHPAHAQQDDGHCRYVQAAKVALHYAGDPLAPALDSTINGAPAVMLLSTGAFTNLLTMTGAIRHHLPLKEDPHRYIVTGAATYRVYRAQVDSFSVGPSRTGSIELEAQRAGDAPLNDGVVGAGYLFQADLEIALADKQIKFFNPGGSACDGAFLAYWDPNAVVVRAVPAHRNHENPHFTVELNGQSFDAIISSGSPRSYIDRSAAIRAGAKFEPAASAGQQSSARFDKLSIGAETIANPQLDVVELKAAVGADVNLGADFLRTHRVLFARSQKKLYISYVGGIPFGPRKGIEPWLQQEADAGNRDAELALARAYSGAGGAGQAEASAWLNKAAAHGQPLAAFRVGRSLMAAGRYAEAAVHLRRAVDELPSDRAPALLLYLVRVRMGDTEHARRELAQLVPPPDGQGRNFLTAFLFGEDRPWPLPIADYYLGRIDAGNLLAQAAKRPYPELRVSEANYSVDALRAAQAGSAVGAGPEAAPETVSPAPPPPANPEH